MMINIVLNGEVLKPVEFAGDIPFESKHTYTFEIGNKTFTGMRPYYRRATKNGGLIIYFRHIK